MRVGTEKRKMTFKLHPPRKSAQMHELKARLDIKRRFHHTNSLKVIVLILVVLLGSQFAHVGLWSTTGSVRQNVDGMIAHSRASPAAGFDFSLSNSGNIVVPPGGS